MTEKSAPARPIRSARLPVPIKRGDTEISTLSLRKPMAGELRGVALSNLLQTDVTAILTVLPRISEPPLTQHEADTLEPENLVAVSGEIIAFFLTGEQAAMLATMSQN
jgi:hypothetical protein